VIYSCFNNDENLSDMRAVAFILIATVLEVSGDAVVRMGIYNHAGMTRLGLMLAGAAFLFGYGFSVNLAPLYFGQLAGLYIATLFVVWQIINFIAFRAAPSLPILIGGVLIIAGGLIVSFWKAGH
jgi:small multidrug resistance family-3 protein